MNKIGVLLLRFNCTKIRTYLFAFMQEQISDKCIILFKMYPDSRSP